MSITVNSYILGDFKVQKVLLQPVLGAYELVVLLSAKINPRQAQAIRWVRLHGARLAIRSKGGPLMQMGIARPAQPAEVRQGDYVRDSQLSFSLQLHPHQLSALEDLRDASALDFDIQLFGEGGVGEGSQSDEMVQDNLSVHVPQSEWIEELRRARAFDILLLEVSMPVVEASHEHSSAVAHLNYAQKYFVEGNYKASVGECREVFDALGVKAAPLKLLAPDQRDDMTTEQRESAVFATIRHCTHPAHHSATLVVTPVFERAGAKLLLQLTAACLSLELRRATI